MRGGKFNWPSFTRDEERAGKIMNGADPAHKNMSWEAWEAAQKIAGISRDTRLAGSPRKASK